MKKITIAVLLMISLVIHPLSAQALPTTKSVDFSADLNRVYQDFGNPENGILIAAGKSNKRPKPNSYPTHRTRELRNVKIDNFEVDRSHLSNGTKTTPKTRKHINDPKIQKDRPKAIEAYWKAGKQSGNVRVNNPSSSKDDAGHKLGKQNGGRGDRLSQVMPQNPGVNRGNKGQRDWRKTENDFNKAVKKNGKGTWTVKQYP